MIRLLPSKKARYGAGNQGRQGAVQIGVEAEPVGLGAQGHGAAGCPAAIRGQRESDIHIVERAVAGEAQVDRGLVLDLQQMRQQAALRLLQMQVERELPGAVRESRGQIEAAARRVEPLDGELAVERAAREVERAGDAEARGGAEDRLRHIDRLDVELL